MSNTDSTKKLVLAKVKQFLFLIRHPSCYSYIQSSPVKVLVVRNIQSSPVNVLVVRNIQSSPVKVLVVRKEKIYVKGKRSIVI
jgi:hypothetical protein